MALHEREIGKEGFGRYPPSPFLERDSLILIRFCKNSGLCVFSFVCFIAPTVWSLSFTFSYASVYWL